jgi:hypothetical protein
MGAGETFDFVPEMECFHLSRFGNQVCPDLNQRSNSNMYLNRAVGFLGGKSFPSI